MQAQIRYEFSSKIWKHNADAGWFFVSLPKKISKEIRDNLQWQEEGWGRMKANATIMEFEWNTAIWFDKKLGTYLLPIKAEIRKKAGLNIDDTITVNISI